VVSVWLLMPRWRNTTQERVGLFGVNVGAVERFHSSIRLHFANAGWWFAW